MRPARECFGLDGKARATSIPAAVCKERATPPDGPKRSRPKGCFAFLAWPALLLSHRPLRVCSFVAPWPGQKSKQRGAHGYFNRLLAQLLVVAQRLDPASIFAQWVKPFPAAGARVAHQIIVAFLPGQHHEMGIVPGQPEANNHRVPPADI